MNEPPRCVGVYRTMSTIVTDDDLREIYVDLVDHHPPRDTELRELGALAGLTEEEARRDLEAIWRRINRRRP